MPDLSFPIFQPHPWFIGGHAQTLAGVLLPGKLPPYQATRHEVLLPDGDRVVLHDEAPPGWKKDGPCCLLVHGLGGSHESPYMVRIAAKLSARGFRAFRMDLRGCGAGIGLARLPYHSGRSEDVLAAIHKIQALCPHSPISLVGFSLGGNIVLKLVGELGSQVPPCLVRAMAVCPPIDLAICTDALSVGANRAYDRYFVRLLLRQLRLRRRALPDAPAGDLAQNPPRRLVEFDDRFTAPVCGFGNAANYYRQASCGQFLASIAVPTLIVASRTDPLIPPGPLEQVTKSPAVQTVLTGCGGHLGYFGRSGAGVDPDRRWMDWRVVDWVAGA